MWPVSLPYLVSVETPENEENVRNFRAETAFSQQEIAEKLSDADENKPPVSLTVYGEDGRLSRAVIYGVSVTGRELRSLFGLKSTAIYISESENGLVFTTYGSGHGVGMSQYGAELNAIEGRSYREILEIYYPGTEVAQLKMNSE